MFCTYPIVWSLLVFFLSLFSVKVESCDSRCWKNQAISCQTKETFCTWFQKGSKLFSFSPHLHMKGCLLSLSLRSWKLFNVRGFFFFQSFCYLKPSGRQIKPRQTLLTKLGKCSEATHTIEWTNKSVVSSMGCSAKLRKHSVVKGTGERAPWWNGFEGSVLQ